MSISRDPIEFGGKKVSLHGKFRLRTNKPAEKLHITNIDAFIPFGKTIDDKVYFYDQTGKVPFLLISKKDTIFNPDLKDVDAKNVTTLIQHPNVRLEDMTEAEHMELARRGLKKENPEYTLVNLDKAIIDKHEEEVEMIEIKYLITNKKKHLGKKKLMYIASALGLSTRSEISEEKRYITFLEQALIKFLEGNEKKRKEFYLYYEKIEQAELLYFINEFIALEYVQNFGGIYKVNDVPVGFKIPDIIDWFATNEDVYKGLKLKVQEFHSNKVTS